MVTIGKIEDFSAVRGNRYILLYFEVVIYLVDDIREYFEKVNKP